MEEEVDLDNWLDMRLVNCTDHQLVHRNLGKDVCPARLADGYILDGSLAEDEPVPE